MIPRIPVIELPRLTCLVGDFMTVLLFAVVMAVVAGAEVARHVVLEGGGEVVGVRKVEVSSHVYLTKGCHETIS